MGSKMWNFTGRAAIIPDVNDLKDVMLCKETATLSQTDISSVKVEDILYLRNVVYILGCSHCISFYERYWCSV